MQNTRLKKKPFGFKGFEFQIQIIDDLHPNLVCIKPSQVGLTESQIRKYLGWLRRNEGTKGIYTLPFDIMRDRISQTRIRPLVVGEPVFNPPIGEKPTRRVDLYQIGESFAYITGSTEGDATSIDADILMHDEVDLTDQSLLGLFQSRLQGSKHKIRQRFSTPTYSGFGVDAMYAISDQHEYFIKCPACNQRQLPEFHPRYLCLPGLSAEEIPDDLLLMTAATARKIEFGGAYWRCEKCSKRLDLGEPSRREWVARHPSRNTRGYRVRPTSVDSIEIPYIFDKLDEYRRADNLKGFANTVLGETAPDGDARISEADIRACMLGPTIPDIGYDTPCYIGIDAGATCHITLGMADHAFLWRQVPRQELREFVAGLFKKYRIVSGVMDRYPYSDLAESLRDLKGHEGIIAPVGYATQANAPPLVSVVDEFKVISHWVANRTRALDTVAGGIRNLGFQISGYGQHQTTLISHLRDMIRVENKDTPPFWVKQTGEDHFFHSAGYYKLSMRLIDVAEFRSTADRRSFPIILSASTGETPGLTPNSLMRSVSSDEHLFAG